MTTKKPSPVDAVRAARDWADSLPPDLRSTWIVLATFWPNIFPETETVASLTSVSRATATRRLTKLEQLGAIKSERRYIRIGGSTRPTSSRRTLIMPEVGTSPVGQLPDWVMRAQFPAPECEAHHEPGTGV